MSLGIPLNLCFCLLICLVSGSLVDEKPGSETPVPHHEDEVHHHLMKLMSRFNDFVQNSNKCLPKWLPSNRSCYRYVKHHMSFHDAELECQSCGLNSHLASIHNDEQNAFIASNVVPAEENGNVWIGLHNVNKDMSSHHVGTVPSPPCSHPRLWLAQFLLLTSLLCPYASDHTLGTCFVATFGFLVLWVLNPLWVLVQTLKERFETLSLFWESCSAPCNLSS